MGLGFANKSSENTPIEEVHQFFLSHPANCPIVYPVHFRSGNKYRQLLLSRRGNMCIRFS